MVAAAAAAAAVVAGFRHPKCRKAVECIGGGLFPCPGWSPGQALCSWAHLFWVQALSGMTPASTGPDCGVRIRFRPPSEEFFWERGLQSHRNLLPTSWSCCERGSLFPCSCSGRHLVFGRKMNLQTLRFSCTAPGYIAGVHLVQGR